MFMAIHKVTMSLAAVVSQLSQISHNAQNVMTNTFLNVNDASIEKLNTTELIVCSMIPFSFGVHKHDSSIHGIKLQLFNLIFVYKKDSDEYMVVVCSYDNLGCYDSLRARLRAGLKHGILPEILFSFEEI